MATQPNESPLAILQRRYAQGEIGHEEYERIRADLLRDRGIGGRPVDGPLKDTLTVRHMERFDIEFVANNPGAWLFHCHNLVHMRGGLMTEVRYR